MEKSDRILGIGNHITYSDFVGSTLVGAGAVLLSGMARVELGAQASMTDQWTGYGGVGDYAKAGPVRLGTAVCDRGRCLPWAMETPCVVCEEVCPVSPKAIGTYEETITRWDGKQVTLNKPYMRPELCIGCGICETECPVIDSAAVYVTAIGETRDKNRSLLLGSKKSLCGEYK